MSEFGQGGEGEPVKGKAANKRPLIALPEAKGKIYTKFDSKATGGFEPLRADSDIRALLASQTVQHCSLALMVVIIQVSSSYSYLSKSDQ